MNRRVVTALDVAREAGVHPSTVSRSLDPSKRGSVKQSTRERVEHVAAQLRYRPNLTASSLRRQQGRIIGVLISSFSNPIYGELLHGISSELEKLGYHILIAEVPDELGGDRMASAIEMLQARPIDGLISAASRGADVPVLTALVESGLPVVLSLRWIESAHMARVVNDDAMGGALAAQHLLDLGHSRIVEVIGPTDISTFSERARGFREVLARSRMPVSLTTVQAETPSIDEGQRVMGEMLAARGGVLDATALFAHNDLLAVGAMDALARVGLECPGQISVVGYNDNPLTAHLKPALTTIRLQIDRIGREAARSVVSIIDGTAADDRAISIAPELIIRESTAKASSHGAVRSSLG